MSYSIASSPTLLDHPNTFDDADASNHRDFRLVDGDVQRIDSSVPSGSLDPPPYPEQYSYLTSDDDDETPRTSRYSTISSTQDGQYTPRVASPSDDSMRKRFSPTISQQQRTLAGKQPSFELAVPRSLTNPQQASSCCTRTSHMAPSTTRSSSASTHQPATPKRTER